MEKTDVPFGYAADGKIYLRSWADHTDREIGEVRDEDIEKSAAFFIERFEDLKKKVEDVIRKIDEAENKGSFLMKLLHLKELLPKHDGLGDYLVLQEQIERYESLVKDIIQKNRERNSEIKTALIEEAKEAVKAINWKEGTEKVNDIKARWIKTGNAEEDKQDELEAAFWDLIKDFFERKKNFYEDKQKLTEMRKRQYEELVAEAEKVSAMHGKGRFDRVKELRAQWKEVGGVPSEIFKPLIEQFNAHLKAQKGRPKTDYSMILNSLQSLKSSKEPINKKELDLIKRNALADKQRSLEKKQVLEWIQLLTEREFINDLAVKRFKDFLQLDKEKKKNIRTGIIKDLIARDKQDLKTFEENSANFSSADGNFTRIVEGKIKGQQRKISIKEKLLDWLEKDEF